MTSKTVQNAFTSPLIIAFFALVLLSFSAVCPGEVLGGDMGADTDAYALPEILQDRAASAAHLLPDFSYAGYNNGVGKIPRAKGIVLYVVDFGAIADDGVDDSKALQAVIEKAAQLSEPVVIRFAKGRYRITEVLRIERSNIVLQGSGSGDNGTTLYFPRPLNQIDKSASLDELREYITKLDKRQKEPAKNVNEYFSEYSWSGGFIWIQKPGTRPAPYLEDYDPEINKLADIEEGHIGSNQIKVSSSSDLEVGDVIQIQWINKAGADAGIIKSLYGKSASVAGSHHWSFPERPLIRQITRVLAVDKQTVSIGDPLLHDANNDIPAQVASWEHLSQVGVEDLHLEFPQSPYFGHHLERGYNGIYVTSAFDSWVRDVRISNADAGILTYNSASLTLSNIVSEGSRKGHYAVHMGNVHNVLAENVSIFNPVEHSLTFNTQSTKCVYKNAQVFNRPVLDQHAGSNHQNLFDNVTLHIAAVDSENGKVATVFDGSGAGYWQPGHGRYNTTWNLNIDIVSGAYPDEEVTVLGIDEGPDARIVGLHGNRQFKLDYRPQPYVEFLNRAVLSAPSLYDYQMAARLKKR